MIALLLELTLRGSLIFALTWLFDRLLAGHMQARSRRLWWWIVAFSFLVPLPLRLPILPPIPPMSGTVGTLASELLTATHTFDLTQGHVNTTAPTNHFLRLLPWIWLLGVVLSASLIVIQTTRTSRRWASKRLCTDSVLLDLLEDCKADAGITAPIGLVLSENAASPALLGWLRPRILLPSGLASSLSSAQLRAVFLHELAHFRALDVPLHWLFTAARAIHWFNPLVHLSARRWLHQRELAADETALRWLSPQQRPDYGDALVAALKHASTFPVPYGALALGESIENLKQRIIMITRHASLLPLGLPAGIFTFVLAALLILQPIRADQNADAKNAATTAAQTWLTEIDAGHYTESWTTAASSFQAALTSEQWASALEKARTPLGKCLERKLVSSLPQNGAHSSKGQLLEGEFLMMQYESSFENGKYMRETVTFTKEKNGSWKAAGYFIKPR